MKELIEARTLEALRLYGDEASAEFYRRLALRRLCSTRCDGCQRVAFPPRSFCPTCHSRKVSWVELPAQATLYAFTEQQRSLRFMSPDVLGLVEVEGVGHFLSRIDAPFESLSLGQPLALDFVLALPGLWLHQYRPVG